MKATLLWAMAGVAIAAGPAVCLCEPLVSPASESDAVLAMRSEPEGELRLKYRKEEPGKNAEDVSFGIATDYHYINAADGFRIYDYKLRRIFWTRSPGNFVNDSLYADVWFRGMELKNRAMLGGMLKGAGIAATSTATTTDPFWVETELGMISADLPRRALQRIDDKARTRWLLDGDEVAAVRYETGNAPDEVKPGLRRFWRTVVQVHPDIADALAASGRLPAELWIKRKPLGKDDVVAHFTLASKHWERVAPYPLSAHLAAEPTKPAGAFPDIFATLSKEVSEKTASQPPRSYEARADAAIEHGAGLEAMLWVIEMSLAQGVPASACLDHDPRAYCALSVRAGPLAKMDPRTAVAFMRQAPDAVDRAQFANLPNAYLLRLLWATRPGGKGVDRADTERDLLAALQASPVANFCKDTGDFYAGGWQPFAAWQVWDMGRLMAGHVSGDLLGSIDILEASLAKQEAAFF